MKTFYFETKDLWNELEEFVSKQKSLNSELIFPDFSQKFWSEDFDCYLVPVVYNPF